MLTLLRMAALGFGIGSAVCVFFWLRHGERIWLRRALLVFATGAGLALLFFLVVILDRIAN